MTAAVLAEVHKPAVPALPADTADLLATLAKATVLADLAHAQAVALALDDIGDVVLPDVAPLTADDQALIRAVAPLYLAAQLEEAALIPAAETLTALAMSGAFPIDFGQAAALIQRFWQERNERFHENERRAFFARLFGTDNSQTVGDGRGAPQLNTTFEDLMINLTEAFYKLDEEVAGGPRAQTRVRIAARSLAENLLRKASGVTAFAAKEILATIRSAVQILTDQQIERAVGGRSLWTAVQAIAKRYLHIDPDTSSYVTRGKSGLIILSWLADSLPRLDTGGTLVTLDHPVIGAATEWLEASLTIREAGTRAGA